MWQTSSVTKEINLLKWKKPLPQGMVDKFLWLTKFTQTNCQIKHTNAHYRFENNIKHILLLFNQKTFRANLAVVTCSMTTYFTSFSLSPSAKLVKSLISIQTDNPFWSADQSKLTGCFNATSNMSLKPCSRLDVVPYYSTYILQSQYTSTLLMIILSSALIVLSKFGPFSFLYLWECWLIL